MRVVNVQKARGNKQRDSRGREGKLGREWEGK